MGNNHWRTPHAGFPPCELYIIMECDVFQIVITGSEISKLKFVGFRIETWDWGMDIHQLLCISVNNSVVNTHLQAL